MPTSRRKPSQSGTAKKAVTPAKRAARAAPAKRATRAAPTEDRIVLTGPPALLRATVTVANAVDERVAVRGVVVHREGEPTVGGTASALIPPGATAAVPVTVGLDRTTAPGEHTAEVEVGGIRRPARLVVDPDPAVRVSPRRTLAAPGRTAVRLTVVNEGNVPIPLATVTRARTDDGGPDPGPDVTLTLDDPPVVEPGTSLTLDATLSVPGDLDPTRRHTARVPVGTADVDVIVLPRNASETPS